MNKHHVKGIVALHDIRDVEYFVAKIITKAIPNLPHDEFQELKSEGIAILYQLAARYEPHRDGYATPGSFAGYASMFLPRRLGDAWHRMHPEHTYVTETLPDGRQVRRWRYLAPPTSLDQLLTDSDAAGEHGTDQAARHARAQLHGLRTGGNMVPQASPYARPVPSAA